MEEHEVSGFETMENWHFQQYTECYPSFSHADFTSPEFYRVREIESCHTCIPSGLLNVRTPAFKEI